MSNKQTLDNFVEEVISGWMIRDLNKMLDLPVTPNSPGNCNFPIALYVFSCIEFLGQLTPSKQIDASRSNYTKTSVLGFIDDFFPSTFKDNLQPFRQQFVNIFRNGLSHNYFAKNAGVSRKESKPFQVNQNGNLILDADKFARAFIEAVEKLKLRINSDLDLAKRMVDRYNEQFKNNLLYNFSTSTRQTITTTTSSSSTPNISGPSLTHPKMVKDLQTTTLPYSPDDNNN